jgi:hypothetical protein
MLGSEQKREVLEQIACGALPTSEVAAKQQCKVWKITRRRQAVEQLIGGAIKEPIAGPIDQPDSASTREVWHPGLINDDFQQLLGALNRLKAAIRCLFRQTYDQFGRLGESSSPEEFESVFDKLDKTPVARIQDANLQEVHSLAQAGRRCIVLLQQHWDRLKDLLAELISEVSIDLAVLRERAADVQSLSEVAFSKFAKFVSTIRHLAEEAREQSDDVQSLVQIALPNFTELVDLLGKVSRSHDAT